MFYDFSNTKWSLFSINSYDNNRKGNYFPMRGNINRYTFVLSYSKQWRIYLSEAFQRFWERVTHIFSRYPCLAVSASSEFIKFVGHHVDAISIQVHVKTSLICSSLLLRPVIKITITHLPIYMSLLLEKNKKKNKTQTNKVVIHHWNTKITLAKEGFDFLPC